MDRKILWDNLTKVAEQGDISQYVTTDTGRTIYLRPKDPMTGNSKEEISKGNFELFTSLSLQYDSGESAGEYEALVLEGQYTPSFKSGLLLFMASLTAPMKQSLDAISSFLKNSSKVTLDDVLGAFAEITVLEKVKNCIPRHDKSNFDLAYNDKAVEIKAISPRESAAWFSDTQLTSDKTAIILLIELVESNEGFSLHELAKITQSSKHERYEWIFSANSQLLHEKYEARRYAIFRPTHFCSIDSDDFKSENENLKFITAKIRFRVNPDVFKNHVSILEREMSEIS